MDFDPGVKAGGVDYSQVQLAFVTKNVFGPGRDFSSIEEADNLCIQAGADAALPKTRWRAIMQGSAKDAERSSARDDVVIVSPVYVVTGYLIAADAPSFWDAGQWEWNLEVDETGHLISSDDPLVWTGVPAAGLPSADCGNWTSGADTDFGWAGDVNGGTNWLHLQQHRCTEVHHLYCVSQPDDAPDNMGSGTGAGP